MQDIRERLTGASDTLITPMDEGGRIAEAAPEKGEDVRAARLIDEMRVFEDIRAEEMGGTNVTVVKAAMAMLGLECGSVRQPAASPLTSEQEARLHGFLVD